MSLQEANTLTALNTEQLDPYEIKRQEAIQFVSQYTPKR